MALFVVRVGCFLAGLIGWLVVTGISCHFLMTARPHATVNPSTGDPILYRNTFEFGAIGSSSLLSIPVNDYTKILVAGVFLAATLGFAFFAYVLFGQKKD
ncbi:hypothetical protein K2Y11_10130 [bacterium]|nr:hypothetical protein [bacterium]